jgi:hypothetical protein
VSRFGEKIAKREKQRKLPAEQTIYLSNTEVGIIAVGAQSVSDKVARIHPDNTYATNHNMVFKRKDGSVTRFFDSEDEALAQLRKKLEAAEKSAAADLERAKRNLARARVRVERLNAGEEVRLFDAMQRDGSNKLSKIDGGWMHGPKGPFLNFDETTEGYDGEDESLQEDA